MKSLREEIEEKSKTYVVEDVGGKEPLMVVSDVQKLLDDALSRVKQQIIKHTDDGMIRIPILEKILGEGLG